MTTVLCIVYVSLLPSFSFAASFSRKQPVSAQSFVDSIGINVHLNYTDTVYGKFEEVIKPKLIELGISHIRSNNVYLRDLQTQGKIKELSRHGIKSSVVFEPKYMNIAEIVKLTKNLKNYLDSVEGVNEWDLHSKFAYEGQNFPLGVKKFQARLYSAIKSNSSIRHIDVIGPSLGRPENIAKLGKVKCDIGNMHSYPGGYQPTNGLDEKWIPQAKSMCESNTIIATESGYHNATKSPRSKHQRGVPENAAGKYMMRLLYEYFDRDVKRTYIYELIDLKPNIAVDIPKYNYGLLRNDGSEKLSFVGLRNTIALLKESKNPETKTQKLKQLDYTLSGSMNNVRHLLLQKSNGDNYLILWQDVKNYDPQKQRKIPVRKQTVEISLIKPVKRANLINPLKSTTPALRMKNKSNMSVNVRDYPIILELIDR